MRYNVSLGMLATEAMTELSKATAHDDYSHYRAFLERSAEFCRSLRRSYSPLHVDLKAAPSFVGGNVIYAVLKRESARAPYATAKVKTVDAIEPLIARILSEGRAPTSDESLQIAEVLYETSAADPS